MYDLLNEFASAQHQVSLPGIGVIGLERSPAKADFSEKMFYPPSEQWTIKQGMSDDERFIQYVAHKTNVSTAMATEQVQMFCNYIMGEIKNAGEVSLPGIGLLKNDESGVFHLEPVVADNLLLKPIIAERIIRKDAEHKILVGDTEKTNTEMTALLNYDTAGKSYGWLSWAAALLIFAIGLILYQFANSDWSLAGAGNQQTIDVAAPPAGISAFYK